MAKLNCWEVKKCGRAPREGKVSEPGVCPATTDESSDGLNSGRNGGRICWAIAGTLCGGTVQGDFAQKQDSCMSCDVFKMVKKEEKPDRFHLLKPQQSFKSQIK
jgi:hypothetical protein